MTFFRKTAAGSVAFAMVATGLTPAFAATSTHPANISGHKGPVLEQASDYRRWRRHRHRDRVDAGDIIAGIGILAGIAIIADAASKSSKRERRSDRRSDYPHPERRYPSSNDLGAAVSACSNAAETAAGDGTRVDEIRSATRDGEGWRVSGYLSGNRGFDCGVTAGNVDFIQLNDRAGEY